MRSILFIGFAIVLLALPLHAQEWTQFRGPDGQGHTEAAGLPLTWSETENIKWKCEIPGQGWSSPVVSGSQVWMTTATEDGKSLRVVSVDLASGKIRNDVEVFHPQDPLKKHRMNSYADPSPVIEGERLYVHFGTNGTACLSTQTAAVLWKRGDIKHDHVWGPGSSPALWGDKLIIPWDGRDAQFVLALNKETGETAWKIDRSSKDGNPPKVRGGFCTGLPINVNGVDQIVIPGPNRAAAYDPNDGKELWWVDYLGFSETARPVYGNGLLYFTTGNGKPTLMAIRPGGTGDLTETGVVWKINMQVPTIPSPVLVGNRLYVVQDEGGMAFCLDALTGSDVWREKIGGKYCASLLAAPGRIYFFDRDGTTTVLQTGDTFKILAQNKLDNGCMASAAVAGNALILRTKTHLYRIEK
ncbi:MAG: PQQ-binding-like beta-propeller repeat protein [Verrucomicrobia bacterium]|nr:PQQ-binding-like beta-propeller repeat protein [Verrucomicrobiota bacterium]